MPLMPVHPGTSVQRPLGQLQSWSGDAGRRMWLHHMRKRAPRCSRGSALQATFAVNTAIIPDSLRLSGEMRAHLEWNQKRRRVRRQMWEKERTDADGSIQKGEISVMHFKMHIN